MRTTTLLLAAGACLIAVPAAAADEVRLKSGRVLVGETEIVGDSLHVHTRDGLVVVPREDVLRVRSEAELRADWQQLAGRAGASPHARLGLARAARDIGLDTEMWDMVEAVMRERVPGSPEDQRLRSFLGELEPVVLPVKWRDDPTRTRVRELLLRIQPQTRPGIAAAVAAVLAAEPGADELLRQHARSASIPARRLAAVSALMHRPAEGNDRFVYRSAIVDASPEVRSGVAALLRERGGSAEAIAYLAGGLLHEAPVVRIRTAEAFGDIGDEAALAPLVAAGPAAGQPPADAGGGSTRAHVAFLRQESYVRDFEVEVAQASFIADPQVDVLQSGVVLDTTVHAVVAYRTQIVRAYRRALRRIAGSDPGADPATWAAWLAQRGRQGSGPADAR